MVQTTSEKLGRTPTMPSLTSEQRRQQTGAWWWPRVKPSHTSLQPSLTWIRSSSRRPWRLIPSRAQRCQKIQQIGRPIGLMTPGYCMDISHNSVMCRSKNGAHEDDETRSKNKYGNQYGKPRHWGPERIVETIKTIQTNTFFHDICLTPKDPIADSGYTLNFCAWIVLATMINK